MKVFVFDLLAHDNLDRPVQTELPYLPPVSTSTAMAMRTRRAPRRLGLLDKCGFDGSGSTSTTVHPMGLRIAPPDGAAARRAEPEAADYGNLLRCTSRCAREELAMITARRRAAQPASPAASARIPGSQCRARRVAGGSRPTTSSLRLTECSPTRASSGLQGRGDLATPGAAAALPICAVVGSRNRSSPPVHNLRSPRAGPCRRRRHHPLMRRAWHRRAPSPLPSRSASAYVADSKSRRC